MGHPMNFDHHHDHHHREVFRTLYQVDEYPKRPAHRCASGNTSDHLSPSRQILMVTRRCKTRPQDGLNILPEYRKYSRRSLAFGLAAKTDLQVVVNNDSFQFEISGSDGYGRAELSGRIKQGQLILLVDALKKTKEQRFIIELPASEKEISFSTLEAKKWLTGLLEGCLDNLNESIPPTVSFIGNWYVQNPKACKDKPGESAELVTYTRDRTMGPEMSCKILRATLRGAATELDLLCNGEGERGVRQKELVQVVNGHLEVSYVVNGRKSTDKYLRCP
jgi:hypothetical protein